MSAMDESFHSSLHAKPEFNSTLLQQSASNCGSEQSFNIATTLPKIEPPPLVETVNMDTISPQRLSFVAPALVLDETEPFDSVPKACRTLSRTPVPVSSRIDTIDFA